jgi:hypothetical protein
MLQIADWGKRSGTEASSEDRGMPKIAGRGNQLPRVTTEKQMRKQLFHPSLRADPKSELPVHFIGHSNVCELWQFFSKNRALLPAWMRVLRHQKHGCFADKTF